jgi:uncharacterized SAM-binding protein YcdF (DUF218 family)
LFFLASKTFGALLVPSTLIIAIGAIGLILTWGRFQSVGRKLLVFSVAALLVCGYLPIGKLLIVPLETRFSPWRAENGEPAGIIVLGGGVDPVLSVARGTRIIDSSGARIVVAAALARRYPRTRLVYAGGNSDLLQQQAKEADVAAAIFESLGIGQRLQIEKQSRNTEENVRFSKLLADPKPSETWLLVTSAFNMPRSIGIFRKAGFLVQPYPVDARLVRHIHFSKRFSQRAEAHQYRGSRVDWATSLQAYREDRRPVSIPGSGKFRQLGKIEGSGHDDGKLGWSRI